MKKLVLNAEHYKNAYELFEEIVQDISGNRTSGVAWIQDQQGMIKDERTIRFYLKKASDNQIAEMQDMVTAYQDKLTDKYNKMSEEWIYKFIGLYEKQLREEMEFGVAFSRAQVERVFNPKTGGRGWKISVRV